MSCHRDYGLENYPDCSNHGECISGKCICHSGWTYMSGLEFSEGYDCDIDVLAIQIIFSIVLAFSCIALIIAVYNFYLYPISLNQLFHLKNICILSFTFYIIGAFLISYRRVVDPINYVNGNDFISTTGLGIQTNAIALALYSLLNLLMNFLFTFFRMTNRIRQDKFIRRLLITRYSTPFTIFCGFSMSFISFIGHFYPKKSDLWNRLTILLFTICMVTTCIVFQYVCHVFISEIEDFLTTIKLNQTINIIEINNIIKNIKLQQKIILYLTLQSFPVNLCFIFWKFLTRKYDYFYGFESIFGLIISIVTIQSFWKKENHLMNITNIIINEKSLLQPINNNNNQRKLIFKKTNNKNNKIIYKKLNVSMIQENGFTNTNGNQLEVEVEAKVEAKIGIFSNNISMFRMSQNLSINHLLSINKKNSIIVPFISNNNDC